MTMLVSGWERFDDFETPLHKCQTRSEGRQQRGAGGSLFTDVRLLAVVGEDFPDEMRRKLERPRIDLAGLQTIAGGKTSRGGRGTSYDMTRGRHGIRSSG